MATATKTFNVRVELGSAGNLQAQELIRARGDKSIHILRAELSDLLDAQGNYGGTIDAEVEGTDYVRSVGAVNYTSGTTATVYTVTVGGQISPNATGVAGNGYQTAQAVAAVVNAHAVLSRWVEATAVDTGGGAGRLVLTLRAFIGNAADLGNQIALVAAGVGATVSAATFGSGTGGVAGTNSPSTNKLGQL